MKEILITSTVLIAALLVLRQAFRNTLSRRIQYALWALVLVRLLVPVSLPAMDFSVLTAVGSAEETAAAALAGQPEPMQAAGDVPASGDTPSAQPNQPSQPENDKAARPDQNAAGEERTLSQALVMVWVAGMVLVGAGFLLSNLRFWRKLCRTREFYPVEGFSRRVYLIEDGAGSSPFLFGLFRPAVYLPAAAAMFPAERLRHVLVHEDTHARHLDPLWALLRGVCLTVYWFDPLVWVAAACAKTDCELACDEGALARLGEEQRISYGQTILSLIPVEKGPEKLLLTASTMAARKRQMEDRITRIAQGPRQVLAAAVLAVLLAAGVSACTFTGGAADSSASLTGEELQFFNEVYFNGDGYNIRNQFLSSTYKRPEDIDLSELFYCEGSAPSDEELRTVLGADPDNLICPAYKLTTGEMDQILTEYMGLTLEETKKNNLRFDYDAASDAYYWMHGDTNYRSYVFFPVGTRDGQEVTLYYQDEFMGEGWKRLTLRDQGNGTYHFVSNLPCGKPAIATNYSAGTPDRTLSLTQLPPYEAPAVSTEPHVGDYVTFLENWDFDGRYVQTYRAADGVIYAAVVAEDETRQVFFSGLSEDHSMFFFRDLFGYDGFFLRYAGETPTEYGGSDGTVTDFYYFSQDDTPVLLARCYGSQEPRIVDLDGDGTNELISDCQIFFQREGKVRQAILPELLQTAYPAQEDWDSAAWDLYSKCLHISSAEGQDSGTCDLYFAGDSLLLYHTKP